jgi:hypothetical protein
MQWKPTKLTNCKLDEFSLALGMVSFSKVAFLFEKVEDVRYGEYGN